MLLFFLSQNLEQMRENRRQAEASGDRQNIAQARMEFQNVIEI